ncbi:MAG: glycosyltransferase [Candidatus Rokubacteria bacterium]|nr:glycosyltransferase [Candidatus Rokubacteria bacterium]
MRILIDLQPLQTQGAADRGIGRYTNGLLRALAASHEVIGLRLSGSYLVAPAADVPSLELRPGLTPGELSRIVGAQRVDVVVNCSGPYWEQNRIVSDLGGADRPLVASIFYDVIPWVFPDVYLRDPRVRRSYHNRCVDLYARADLVCGISQHSSEDAQRFGYARAESVATISTGVEPLVPERRSARDRWKIPRPFVLSVSGDEFRKNPEALIEAFLRSTLARSRCLVLIVSNDAQTGFSRRMRAKYGDLSARAVLVLPAVTEGQLGALYRDSEAFVFSSSYEGFGMPVVEAMQFGRWIVSPRSSCLAEVAGPALLEPIEEPAEVASVVAALDRTARRLDAGPLDETVPRGQARLFTWARVGRNFEEAVDRRCRTMRRDPADAGRRPRLFWASPFPADVSGIAFYSEDLVPLVGRRYEIVLVPNTVSTFVPTPKTGPFKLVEPEAGAVREMSEGEPPFVFYHVGNSHFHLDLLDLLFAIPGVVLLHDSFVKGLEGVWRARRAGVSPGAPGPASRFRWWCWRLAKIERLLEPAQPTRLRGALGVVARVPGAPPAVRLASRVLRRLAGAGGGARGRREPDRRASEMPLDAQIIESSRATLFLGEHAKSLIAPEWLARGPMHVVPLFARYRGPISPARKAELRRKYAIPADAFVVTTTGFQTRTKLTNRIVASCVELEKREGAPPVYVQVLGHFFEADLLAEVHALVEESGIRAFVSGGFLDEDVLLERVALSDAAVFLRDWTTGGPSAGLNDALGMGVPAVVTDDFAFREYPATAVLRVRNSEVTEGLLRLSRDDELRRSLAAGGLEYARDISPERIAARLGEVCALYEPGRPAPAMSDGAASRVFVDLTFGFLNDARSGLQRVEREIASGLRELDPSARHFTFVAWDGGSRTFSVVSLDHLKRRERLPPPATWLGACPPAEIGGGDHLFVLGSNWPLGESYFADLLGLAARGVRLSVLVPDLIPIRHRWSFYAHHPEGTTIDLFRTWCAQLLPVCVNVLTISNHVMADIEKLLVEIGGVARPGDGPRIRVLRLGADWTAPIADAESASRAVGPDRLVEHPYVLCVSTLEKRKNHERLLEAFTRVRRQVANLNLVLVGAVDGSMSEATLELIRKSLWIHHFDKVDDATLSRLYRGCLFSVYASLDEGYGLPVVESFSHGKFALAARAGAIPEAGEAFADYFDPCDVAMLAEKILGYVLNPAELEGRVALLASYRPASWRDTARQVAEVFYGDAATRVFGAPEEA